MAAAFNSASCLYLNRTYLAYLVSRVEVDSEVGAEVAETAERKGHIDRLWGRTYSSAVYPDASRWTTTL